MIKHFCDVCGDETVRNVVSNRIKETRVMRGTTVEVEIIVGIDGTWNSGDLCRSCLFDVLDKYDVRPKAGVAE